MPSDLRGRGIAFRSLTEQMDTTTPHGELLVSIFGALAFAIVTTEANTPMHDVHDRMPVILAPDDWAEWLESDEDPAMLLRPAPDALLRFWPVSKAVNSPRNNSAELLAEQPQQAAEGGRPNPA